MRKIKFMVNNVVELDYITSAVMSASKENDLWRVWDEDNCELIWGGNVRKFTGVYDANGTEIYEGDIVSGVKNTPLEVAEHCGAFGFMLDVRASLYSAETRKEFLPLCQCDLSELRVVEAVGD